MIFDSIAHIEAYKGNHPGIYKGLELLRDTDFGAKADGTYQVDGDDLFYFIQSYETKPANDTPRLTSSTSIFSASSSAPSAWTSACWRR